MTNTLKKISKLLLFIIIVYSFLWYGIGIYFKINIKKFITHHTDYIVTHENVDLGGYPFAYEYKITNLVLSPEENGNLLQELRFRELLLSTDLLLKEIQIDILRNLHLNVNNKDYYCIKWDEGALIKAEFGNSLLKYFINPSKTEPKLKHFTYFDSGYNILDKNLDQIIFISHNNDIRISLDIDNPKNSNHLSIHLEGEGGDNLPSYIRGQHNISISCDYRIGLDDTCLLINKFKFSTDRYNIDIEGNLNSGIDSKSNPLKIEINNFSSFCGVLEDLLKEKKANMVKNAITSIATNNYNKNVDKILISIPNKTRYTWISSSIIKKIFVMNNLKFLINAINHKSN